MLDTATKRRIDTARDILVGKVPDPKSQVEQITIALIYKFMDDIDAGSEEMGGQRTFFAGDFARYGWPQLVRAGLGGHETLNLYAEAITRMPENPGIPPLFRDIFNNAYLPYRDPETLRAFLKVIDEFTYDHSERLGDAFEYLLSVLGSQGDAGQFRTPRHIIDFIVAVIDPKKDETILDPACGTAGFLISSYKHILKSNIDDEGNSTLTPDEKGTLAANFKGYDISPDMVRLSLVNLYLHGFVEPHIAEYDTLTSEERWNEYADVILANPPFMSPKGGIRPHRRFSVQSKRSEVLFVDYMAEHLTPTGRAGIIVPEGIIFQSQTAYKQLRKMLVENYLVAVISLPAGVFQPYSGVKTSILLLDKALANKTDRIAFFKVENDGFDLGAQRREIAENDLPQVREELGEYLGRVRVGESVTSDGVAEPTMDYTTALGLIAEKEKIAVGGEYNLSGERYREREVQKSTYSIVPLKEVCDLVRGVTYSKKDEVQEGGHQVLRANNIVNDTSTLGLSEIKLVSESIKFSDDKKLQTNDIFICMASGSKDHIGKVAFITSDTDYHFGGFMGAVRAKLEHIEPAYLFYQLRHNRFNDYLREQIIGANINNLGTKLFYQFRLPLPSLEVQREIVAEIEGYQRVIEGARAVIDNYRPQIVVDPEWPIVELGDICDNILSGGTPSTKNEEYWKGDIPWITSADIVNIKTAEPRRYITEEAIRGSATNLIEAGNIIVVTRVGLGKLFKNDFDVCISQDSQGLMIKDGINADYLVYVLKDKVENFKNISQGSTIQGVTKKQLSEIQIPLPPLEAQCALADEIEAEQSLVAANRELVERMEGKIRAAIGRVWGKGDTVPAMTKVEND